MGSAFSKKVGDRSNVEFGGQNPFSTQGQAQAQVPQATPYQDVQYGEKAQIPTGIVINETTTTTTSGGWGTQATLTTPPPPTQTSSAWGSTVQNTNTAHANGSTTATAWTGAWGSNNEPKVNPVPGAFMFLFFIFLFVGVPVLITWDFDYYDNTGGGFSPPTRSPTEQLLLGDVELCPTAQFFGGQNKLTAGCDTDGCSGSVRWCGLNDAFSYRVQAGVRGDLDLLVETVTIAVSGGGSPTVAGTVSQCSSSYEAKVDEIVSPSGGEFNLTFSTTGSVNFDCYGSIVVLLEITVTEIP